MIRPRTLLCIGTAIMAFTAIAAPEAFATSFEPPVKEICDATKSVRPESLVVSLFDAEGITDRGIDTTGGDVTAQLRASILDQQAYCSTATAHCAQGEQAKIGTAQSQLYMFLRRVSAGVEKQYAPVPGQAQPSDLLHAVLTGGYRIQCMQDSNAASAQQSAVTPNVGDVLEVRSTVEDLNANPSNFNGLTPASASFDYNNVAHAQTYSLNGVFGYGIPSQYFDNSHASSGYFDLFGYVIANVKAVDAVPKKSGTIDNVGEGVLFSTLFNAGIYHSFELYPQFTHSLYDRSSTVSLTANYLPEPALPYLGAATNIGGEIQLSLQPIASLSFMRVTDAGTNSALALANEYLRVGPGLDLAVFGEKGRALEKFSLSANYIYFDGLVGTPHAYTNFLGSLNYAPFASATNGSQNFTITLKYSAGRDLVSLASLDDVTLGIGFKY
jgi:hypothetical protein